MFHRIPNLRPNFVGYAFVHPFAISSSNTIRAYTNIRVNPNICANASPSRRPWWPVCQSVRSLIYFNKMSKYFIFFFKFDGFIRFPAGVNPSLCPNYPYCNIVGAPAAVAPLPGFTERLYPAGLYLKMKSIHSNKFIYLSFHF